MGGMKIAIVCVRVCVEQDSGMMAYGAWAQHLHFKPKNLFKLKIRMSLYIWQFASHLDTHNSLLETQTVWAGGVSHCYNLSAILCIQADRWAKVVFSLNC